VIGRVTSVDHPVDEFAVTGDVLDIALGEGGNPAESPTSVATVASPRLRLSPWMGTAVQPCSCAALNSSGPASRPWPPCVAGSAPVFDRGGVDDVIRSVCAVAQDATTLIITDGLKR
jgi:hypothetical protein